jgi:hypothetical protein
LKENTDGWKVVTGKKCSSNNLTVTKENIVTLHNAYSILSLLNNPTIESDNKKHVIVHLSKLARAVASTKQKRLQQRDRLKHIKSHSNNYERTKNYFWTSIT